MGGPRVRHTCCCVTCCIYVMIGWVHMSPIRLLQDCIVWLPYYAQCIRVVVVRILPSLLSHIKRTRNKFRAFGSIQVWPRQALRHRGRSNSAHRVGQHFLTAISKLAFQSQNFFLCYQMPTLANEAQNRFCCRTKHTSVKFIGKNS